MNLNDMTAPELRKLAARFDITGRSTMKKAELVKALSVPELANLLELHFGIIEVETEEREMNEIRAEIAAEAAYIEEGIQRDEAAESEPKNVSSVNVEIERDTRGGRMMYLHTEDGDMWSIRLVKRGRRWETVLDRNYSRFAVKAGSLRKLAKLWAKKAGVWADSIDIAPNA